LNITSAEEMTKLIMKNRRKRRIRKGNFAMAIPVERNDFDAGYNFALRLIKQLLTPA